MTFRPLLRPGAPLLRRDATHLQIGTSPGIVLADRPGLFALLCLLDGTRDLIQLESLARQRIPDLAGSVAGLMAELRAVDVIVDASANSRRTRRRASYEIAFHRDVASEQLVSATRSILSASGVKHLDAAEPALLVIASCGEQPRAVFERSALLGVDHLPLVIDEDRVRIGPLVCPGRTPCMNCHDLHRTDWDRAWPAILHQLGRQAATVPGSALDAMTTHAAALELSAEVLAHVDRRNPRTVGQCLVIGPRHDDRTNWPIAFHHACACDLLNAA